MARLGKRERQAKRQIIAANLAMTKDERKQVRSSGTLAPFMFTASGLSRTYTFRDPRNERWSPDKRAGVAGRFTDQPRKVDVIRGPIRDDYYHADSNRTAALKMAVRKLKQGD